MIRVFTLVLGHDVDFVQPVLFVMAGLSIVLGALGAVAQRDIRSILTWDIISQVGYMVMGLALFTTASVGAAIFFMLQYMPAKAALFSVAAAVEKLRGTGNIGRLGGLARAYPLLAILFILPAMSLGGIPPLSGFWGKLAILNRPSDWTAPPPCPGRRGPGWQPADPVCDVQDMAVRLLGKDNWKDEESSATSTHLSLRPFP